MKQYEDEESIPLKNNATTTTTTTNTTTTSTTRTKLEDFAASTDFLTLCCSGGKPNNTDTMQEGQYMIPVVPVVPVPGQDEQHMLPVVPVPVPVPVPYNHDHGNFEEQQEQTQEQTQTQGHMRIQLSFELDNLMNTRKGWFSSSKERTSPYVLIVDHNDRVKIGKTETAWNSLRTKFTTPIYIEKEDILDSPFVRVYVYDNVQEQPKRKEQTKQSFQNLERSLEEAGSRSGDVRICEHLLDLSQFNNEIKKGSFGLKKLIINDGYANEIGGENMSSEPELNICGIQSMESSQLMELQFRALGVRNVEKGLFNLTRTDPLVVISKKHLYEAENKMHWQAVYKSEHVIDHLNPLWESSKVNLEQLCDGDYEKKLRLEIWDYEESGKNVLVGRMEDELTLTELMEKKALRGNADKTYALNTVRADRHESDSSGLIIVLKADLLA
eukprot:739729_1